MSIGAHAGKRGRSVSDAYGLWAYGCQVQKKGARRFVKAMGHLHLRTVEPHCGFRVIQKVMVIR